MNNKLLISYYIQNVGTNIKFIYEHQKLINVEKVEAFKISLPVTSKLTPM